MNEVANQSVTETDLADPMAILKANEQIAKDLVKKEFAQPKVEVPSTQG